MPGDYAEARDCLIGEFSGWTYIGRGHHREAWLSPSGFVYKRDVNLDTPNNNRTEQRIYESLKIRRWGVWRVADMSFFDVEGITVACAEHVLGDHLYWPGAPGFDRNDPAYEHYWTVMEEVQSEFGVEDIHGDNFIRVSPLEYVIIDLGS